MQLVEFCEDAANAGKVVIVAALDGTFERKVHVLASMGSQLLLFVLQ